MKTLFFLGISKSIYNTHHVLGTWLFLFHNPMIQLLTMTISKHELVVIIVVLVGIIIFVAISRSSYLSLGISYNQYEQAYDTRCYSSNSLNPYAQEESRDVNHRYAYLYFYPDTTIYGYLYDYAPDSTLGIRGEYQGDYSNTSGRSVGEYVVKRKGVEFKEQRSIVFNEHGITFIDTQGNTAVLPLISCQRLNEWNIANDYVFKEI